MDLRQASRRRGIGIVCFLFLVTFAIAFLRPKRIATVASSKGAQDSQGRTIQVPQNLKDQKAGPDSHFERLHGADVVWQVPVNPRAVLFLACGCSHTALDFWEPSEGCPTCRGFPEDYTLKQAAIERGYAVVGVSSQETCWDSNFPPQDSLDAPLVKKAIDDVIKREALQELPRFALGASSGGYFITTLAHIVEFDALAVYIAAGVRGALREPLASGKPYPPTLFVHMPRDDRTAGAVKTAIEELREVGSEAAELRCPPLRMTPGFLAERIRGLDRATSEKVFVSFRNGGFLDKDAFLVENPRRSAWSSLLTSAGPEVEKFTEHIAEELNVLYGWHELTSLKASETFDWFENQCTKNGQLVKGRCREFDADLADARR
ncbi:hypothetical protein KFL_000440130 [Klebsormidium nitens]|uniref:Uncharacterized protein n=1 Tax=Klebsormidium nitens TaxID=105231 RepID=A0A1Y1HSN8_KLENI|nr:hypothetical protein KFL_000440130 [Klebsormidium nitens]|eukprot:GAQ80011.1 hypothetical protein KFL_000440130 [Klebsormidium nitens]